MNQNKKKKVIAFLTTIAMLFGSFSMAYASEEVSVTADTQYSDIKGHWAEAAINSAVANGLLNGYDTGEMKPGANLTRGQLATIMAKAFHSYKQASLSRYTDTDPSAWYYESMAKAVQMKVFKGYNNLLRPEDNITREEVFSVLSAAFKCTGGSDSVLDKFSDKDQISQWAKEGAASLAAEGYISGSGGKLNPKSYISRAEFAQIMYNLLKNYVVKEGTYTTDLNGNTMINAAGVTLKNLKVSGNLIIGDGVGDGEVTLDNVLVTGKVVVRGGGENSIKIIGGSNITDIIVARVDGQVRIFSTDGTEIGQVIVDGSDDVIVEGDVGTVKVLANNVTVVATSAQIDAATIDGENSKIIVGTGTTVNTLTISAPNAKVEVSGQITSIVTESKADGVDVSGSGKVGTVQANSNNVVVTTVGAKVTAGAGTTGVVAGTSSVDETNTAIVAEKSGGGGGGSSNASTISVTSIGAINGTAKVGVELTAGIVSPAGATVNYQWMSCSTSDGTYVNITGATANTYIPAVADEGKYLKVSATGHGGYSATVTSDATAAVLPTAITTAAIFGVAAPVFGATPTAVIAETSEYTATITWNGDPVTFAEATTYTAIITLTPKTGYTLTGVSQNFFTVDGATATNNASAGIITAVFPKTVSFPVSEISNSDVSITQGSVIFQYAFTGTSGAVNYSQALAAPYYLNATQSTVTLSDGTNNTSAVSVGALGIGSDGTVTYSNLSDVKAAFTGLNFVPTRINIHLTGATSINGGSDAWSRNVTVNLDAAEILLLKPPTVSAYSPSDNGTNVARTANLVLTFDQSVTAVGGKSIRIFKSADDSLFETLEATDSAVAVSGNTVTINPSGTFDYSTGYYILIDTGSFSNSTTGDYTEIGDKTAWNFTSVAAPPAVSSFSPADNGNHVAANANLVITFDQNVTAVGGKNIAIYRTADDTVFESVEATNSAVTVAGSTVTINPGSDFTYGAGYYVQVEPGAFTNAVTGDFAGFGDKTTWNFTAVELAPSITGYVVSPGSINTATMITYTPGAGNSLRYVKQAGAFTVPTVGYDASAVGTAYNSGSNISGAAATEHIGLYEVNGSNLVVKFADITLASEDIAVNAPAISGHTVSPGSIDGATKVTYTSGAGNSLRYVKQAGAFAIPLAGADASGIGSVYSSGDDITGAVIGEHIGLYEVDGSNRVVGFIDETLAVEDIGDYTAPVVGTITDASFNYGASQLVLTTDGSSSAINDSVDITKITITFSGGWQPDGYTGSSGNWIYTLTAGTTGKVTGSSQITIYLNGTDKTRMGGTTVGSNGIITQNGLLVDPVSNTSADGAVTLTNNY